MEFVKIGCLILLLSLGFFLLVKGSDFFVDGAAGLAARFKIPQLIIGLTIVAMGTSAPEAAVSITAAFEGNADICIGNIVGSNILNILIILGVASTIIPLTVKKSLLTYEMPYMFACTILLFALGLDGTISFLDGIILWGAFIVYLIYLFISAKKNQSNEVDNYIKPMKIIIYIVIGLIGILIGAKIAVYSATELARWFGVSERFIGLTIVALGTSLPELCTSVVAARKGNADIAIGNIVGSNIFNILFIVGTTSLIAKVPFDSRFLTDTIIAILACVILYICSLNNRKISRAGGVVMLACYGIYFIYLCISI